MREAADTLLDAQQRFSYFGPSERESSCYNDVGLKVCLHLPGEELGQTTHT